MKEYLATLLGYNAWANMTLALALPESLLSQPVKSSFPTLRLTLLHMWSAQEAWFKRVNDLSPRSAALIMKFEGDLSHLIQAFERSCNEWISWLELQREETLNAPLAYQTMAGEPFTNTRAEIIMHMVNHGSFHRGQLVTMMRELGDEKIPQTDMIVYFRKFKYPLEVIRADS